MAVLTTKYSVGDTVWHAGQATEKRQHDCPDCLGTKHWKYVSPAGAEGVFECPRCSASYQSDESLRLSYAWWVPTARRLTVGLVRASSMPGDGYDEGNRYMCTETGIGSGSIYRECDLFSTEAEALAAAKVKADATNADPTGWVAKQYDATVKLSDYQLKDASVEGAKMKARQALYDVGYLVEDIENAFDLDEVKGLITRWREDPSGFAAEASARVSPALSVSPDGDGGEAGMHPENPQQQEARDGRE